MSDLTVAIEASPTGARRRFDQEQDQLIGGRCQQCSTQTWPRRAVCYRCGSADVVEFGLPAGGRLNTWTRVRVPVEGIEPPYLVGLVELGGVQVFGHLRGATTDFPVPTDVRVRVDLSQSPPFWFEIPST